MITSRRSRSDTALLSLDAAASSARAGFACMFSTSDEHERALISERRAQGRYATPHRRWPVIAFVGACIVVVGTVLLFG